MVTMTGKVGTIYLLHFTEPYQHARHYLGWAENLDARLADHDAGRGARLLAVVRSAGITWRLARTWEGTRARERAIKRMGGLARRCPLCGVRPATAAERAGVDALDPGVPGVDNVMAATQAQWTDADSRALTVALVAYDGHRIALRGAEKTEAVQIMVGRGLDTETIADRLRTTPERLRLWARRQGVELSPMREPQAWWVVAAWPSASAENRARQKRERAARLAGEVAA